MQNLTLGRLMVPLAAVLAAATLAPKASAAGTPSLEPETVLYSFCAKGGKTCTDGAGPTAGLIMDAGGKLYGATVNGGAHKAYGTVFELTSNAAKTKWTETVLYSFCAKVECSDGWEPSGLVMDAAGRLYGTTVLGGAHLAGTVFQLTPNATKTKWTETVLHSFAGYLDGLEPLAGLIMDASGNLYGTTSYGAHGRGIVFELTPDASKTSWTETVLHNFCSRVGAEAVCTDGDGAEPAAALILDKTGKLYGTTEEGGLHGGGTVFALNPNAAKTKWTETVLYSFCARGGVNCTDGSAPSTGALTMNAGGKLYGATMNGGAHGAGTVYELTPNAAKTKWSETVLYSFCAQSAGGNPCADGRYPRAGLIMDAAGDLYGTTEIGDHGGTVFELTPNAAKTRWTETVLYGFCARLGCVDGDLPNAGLTMDRSGHLYGTTYGGGAHGGGAVFELP